jgi:RNA ligase
MNYEFPHIISISDVLPAIEGRDEFVVAEKEGYTVINYNVMMADTFDCPIRRECRGIIFDTATGDIIRRPFHKFFNVNEREETQDHVVDLSRDHYILEKLDGSMIAPFFVTTDEFVEKLGGGYYKKKLIWGTKMGATDVAKPVEEFVARNPEYITFADECIDNGWTPIFEWCSRKQRIVLDYFHDQLVLTGLRNMKTGAYALHANLEEIGKAYSIPVVNEFATNTDMKAFLEYVRDLEDVEGFVVRFSDGHMLKLKCQWYLQIHKAKEAILQDRNIVELILDEKLDDIKAHLPAEDRDRLTQFESQFNIAVSDAVYYLANDLSWIRENDIDRKTFALEYAKRYDPYMRATIFKCWDETDDHKIIDAVKNVIRNNLTRTSKYEALRDTWFPGVKYNA